MNYFQITIIIIMFSFCLLFCIRNIDLPQVLPHPYSWMGYTSLEPLQEFLNRGKSSIGARGTAVPLKIL
jgi:hypothetical protein